MKLLHVMQKKLVNIMFLLFFLTFISVYLPNPISNAVAADDKCNRPIKIDNITASGNDGNIPLNVNDGNLSTRWSNKGIGSWIRLDLGSNNTVCGINIAGYKGNERHYDFEISASTDGMKFWKLASYTTNASTLDPEKFSIFPINANVLEVLVKGNIEVQNNLPKNYSSISEIEVYGINNSDTLQNATSEDNTKDQITNSDILQNATSEDNAKDSINNYDIPSISVGTDDSKYSQGEQVTILGRLYNGTGFSLETVQIIVNKTHFESFGGLAGYQILNKSEILPVTKISTISDTLGRFNYNMSLQETGKYLVSASANINGNNIQSISGFEVKNIFVSWSAIMAYFGLVFFLSLLIVIWHGNNKFGDLRDPVSYRLNQKKIANNELLRFLCLSGIAGFSILSFVFADSEVGVNSPIGLIKQNFAALNKTQMQTFSPNQESQWVINVGGTQKDNYSGGIQIPTYVVIFGLAGGYLRYLYGLRFFFGRLSKKQQFEDTDKNWGDLNVMDNMSFLRHSLRSLSLFFLAPLLSIAVWFILFQGGTTGKWAIAAVSFSIGLITEEVIQVIIIFVRKTLVGIKEDTTKEKEDAKIRVVKTVPADGSSGVSVYTDILASFEVPVEKETVVNGFKLFVESDSGKTPIQGKTIQGENSLTYRFVPESRKLDPDKTYVASIDGVVDLVGRACEITTWLFSTRNKPMILKVYPEDKQKVPVSSKITIEFSEPMNSQGIEKYIIVKENGTEIKGKVDVKEKTATFTPDENLEINKTYSVEVTNEIEDLAGNSLVSGKTWVFSTNK